MYCLGRFLILQEATCKSVQICAFSLKFHNKNEISSRRQMQSQILVVQLPHTADRFFSLSSNMLGHVTSACLTYTWAIPQTWTLSHAGIAIIN
jgi:hypothetical protein